MRVLEQVRINVDSLTESLRAIGTVSLRDGIDELLEEGEQELRDWWASLGAPNLNVPDVEANVQKRVAEAIESLGTFSVLLGENITAASHEIDAVHAEIRTRFAEAEDASLQRITDLRANAEKRLREAATVRDQYLKGWKRLQEALTVRRQITDELLASHDLIASIRAKNNRQIEEKLQRVAQRSKLS